MAIEWISPFYQYLFVAICSLYSVYIILLTYYLRIFLGFRRIAFIRKRYPFIGSVEIIATILSIATNFAIIAFYRCIDQNTSLYKYLWNVSIFSQPMTVYAIFYSLLWRCWHFYYDSMLNKHFNAQWETIIDHKQHKNWYLNHKSTFGSSRFVAKIIFLMYFISCIISISVWFTDDIIGYNQSLIIDFAMFLIPYILFFILYRKTPKFGDVLHINDEMKRVNFVIITSLICYLLILGVGVYMGSYQNIFAISMVFSSAFWVFLAAMIHTKWVLSIIGCWMQNSLKALSKSQFNLKHTALTDTYQVFAEKNPKLSSLWNRLRLRTLSDASKTRSTRTRTLSDVSKEDDDNVLHKKNVKEIFDNKHTFRLFMKHLNAEYSIECALSFIEIMQFQRYMMLNEHKLGIKDEDDDICIIIDVGDGKKAKLRHCENQNEQLMSMDFKDYIPRSEIVDADNDKECSLIMVKQKAYDLFIKYIEEGSEYEVNISYSLRVRFTNYMQDYDEWINDTNIKPHTLLSMFNMVSVEMHQLLLFSLSRFKSLLKVKVNETPDAVSEQNVVDHNQINLTTIKE